VFFPHLVDISYNFMQNQVTVPALASVYNEKALKSQFDTSIYLQVCVHLVSCLALAFYSKLSC